MSKLNFPLPSWAVFNQHVNNAGKRARKVVSCLYEQKNLKALRKVERNGIMSMFEQSPMDAACHDYALLCFVFANGLDKSEETPCQS